MELNLQFVIESAYKKFIELYQGEVLVVQAQDAEIQGGRRVRYGAPGLLLFLCSAVVVVPSVHDVPVGSVVRVVEVDGGGHVARSQRQGGVPQSHDTGGATAEGCWDPLRPKEATAPASLI